VPPWFSLLFLFLLLFLPDCIPWLLLRLRRVKHFAWLTVQWDSKKTRREEKRREEKRADLQWHLNC
jgi:hypothetical protein